MSEQTIEQVQADDVIEEVDPFADVDTRPTKPMKLEDQRALALDRAEQLLGAEAFETASFNDAALALKADGHQFFRIMAGSPRQQRKFGRDLRARQPKPESKASRISKAEDLTEDLANARKALSEARTATDAEVVKAQLETVKELADAMLAKL